LNPEDMAKLAKIDKAVTQFTESAKQTAGKVERARTASERPPSGKKPDVPEGESWRRMEDRVYARQRADHKAGINAPDEWGMILEAKASEAEGLYKKVLRDYPEREWDMLRDLDSKEHFIVHGEPWHTEKGGKEIPGQVDHTHAVDELKNRRLQLVDHYHNRLGPSDHAVALPSEQDFNFIFGGKLNAKGDVVRIRYMDRQGSRYLRGYFTQLPADLNKMSEANKKLLERFLGHSLDASRPYVVVYPHARTGKLVGKQFKDLTELDRFRETYQTLTEMKPVKKPKELSGFADTVRKQLKRELAQKEKAQVKETMKRIYEKPR